MRLYFLAWCRAFCAFSPVYKLYNWLDKIKIQQKPSMPTEKTATFLGYSYWGDLLTPIKGDRIAYEKRIIDFSSHSKHSAEEIALLSKEEKNVVEFRVLCVW